MNNNYEIFRIIFFFGLALSILMLIVSVVMFFKMNIRRVLNEYNGNSKRKAIEKIRKKSSGEATTSTDLKVKKEASVVKKENKVSDSTSSVTSKIKAQDRFDGFSAPEETSLSQEQKVESDAEKHNMTSINSLPVYQQRADFVVLTDITYVHSSEVIR